MSLADLRAVLYALSRVSYEAPPAAVVGLLQEAEVAASALDKRQLRQSRINLVSSLQRLLFYYLARYDATAATHSTSDFLCAHDPVPLAFARFVVTLWRCSGLSQVQSLVSFVVDHVGFARQERPLSHFYVLSVHFLCACLSRLFADSLVAASVSAYHLPLITALCAAIASQPPGSALADALVASATAVLDLLLLGYCDNLKDSLAPLFGSAERAYESHHHRADDDAPEALYLSHQNAFEVAAGAPGVVLARAKDAAVAPAALRHEDIGEMGLLRHQAQAETSSVELTTIFAQVYFACTALVRLPTARVHAASLLRTLFVLLLRFSVRMVRFAALPAVLQPAVALYNKYEELLRTLHEAFPDARARRREESVVQAEHSLSQAAANIVQPRVLARTRGQVGYLIFKNMLQALKCLSLVALIEGAARADRGTTLHIQACLGSMAAELLACINTVNGVSDMVLSYVVTHSADGLARYCQGRSLSAELPANAPPSVDPPGGATARRRGESTTGSAGTGAGTGAGAAADHAQGGAEDTLSSAEIRAFRGYCLSLLLPQRPSLEEDARAVFASDAILTAALQDMLYSSHAADVAGQQARARPAGLPATGHARLLDALGHGYLPSYPVESIPFCDNYGLAGEGAGEQAGAADAPGGSPHQMTPTELFRYLGTISTGTAVGTSSEAVLSNAALDAVLREEQKAFNSPYLELVSRFSAVVARVLTVFSSSTLSQTCLVQFGDNTYLLYTVLSLFYPGSLTLERDTEHGFAGRLFGDGTPRVSAGADGAGTGTGTGADGLQFLALEAEVKPYARFSAAHVLDAGGGAEAGLGGSEGLRDARSVPSLLYTASESDLAAGALDGYCLASLGLGADHGQSQSQLFAQAAQGAQGAQVPPRGRGPEYQEHVHSLPMHTAYSCATVVAVFLEYFGVHQYDLSMAFKLWILLTCGTDTVKGNFNRVSAEMIRAGVAVLCGPLRYGCSVNHAALNVGYTSFRAAPLSAAALTLSYGSKSAYVSALRDSTLVAAPSAQPDTGVRAFVTAEVLAHAASDVLVRDPFLSGFAFQSQLISLLNAMTDVVESGQGPPPRIQYGHCFLDDAVEFGKTYGVQVDLPKIRLDETVHTFLTSLAGELGASLAALSSRAVAELADTLARLINNVFGCSTLAGSNLIQGLLAVDSGERDMLCGLSYDMSVHNIFTKLYGLLIGSAFQAVAMGEGRVLSNYKSALLNMLSLGHVLNLTQEQIASFTEDEMYRSILYKDMALALPFAYLHAYMVGSYDLFTATFSDRYLRAVTGLARASDVDILIDARAVPSLGTLLQPFAATPAAPTRESVTITVHSGAADLAIAAPTDGVFIIMTRVIHLVFSVRPIDGASFLPRPDSDSDWDLEPPHAETIASDGRLVFRPTRSLPFLHVVRTALALLFERDKGLIFYAAPPGPADPGEGSLFKSADVSVLLMEDPPWSTATAEQIFDVLVTNVFNAVALLSQNPTALPHHLFFVEAVLRLLAYNASSEHVTASTFLEILDAFAAHDAASFIQAPLLHEFALKLSIGMLHSLTSRLTPQSDVSVFVKNLHLVCDHIMACTEPTPTFHSLDVLCDLADLLYPVLDALLAQDMAALTTGLLDILLLTWNLLTFSAAAPGLRLILAKVKLFLELAQTRLLARAGCGALTPMIRNQLASLRAHGVWPYLGYTDTVFLCHLSPRCRAGLADLFCEAALPRFLALARNALVPAEALARVLLYANYSLAGDDCVVARNPLQTPGAHALSSAVVNEHVTALVAALPSAALDVFPQDGTVPVASGVLNGAADAMPFPALPPALRTDVRCIRDATTVLPYVAAACQSRLSPCRPLGRLVYGSLLGCVRASVRRDLQALDAPGEDAPYASFASLLDRVLFVDRRALPDNSVYHSSADRHPFMAEVLRLAEGLTPAGRRGFLQLMLETVAAGDPDAPRGRLARQLLRQPRLAPHKTLRQVLEQLGADPPTNVMRCCRDFTPAFLPSNPWLTEPRYLDDVNNEVHMRTGEKLTQPASYPFFLLPPLLSQRTLGLLVAAVQGRAAALPFRAALATCSSFPSEGTTLLALRGIEHALALLLIQAAGLPEDVSTAVLSAVSHLAGGTAGKALLAAVIAKDATVASTQQACSLLPYLPLGSTRLRLLAFRIVETVTVSHAFAPRAVAGAGAGAAMHALEDAYAGLCELCRGLTVQTATDAFTTPIYAFRFDAARNLALSFAPIQACLGAEGGLAQTPEQCTTLTKFAAQALGLLGLLSVEDAFTSARRQAARHYAAALRIFTEVLVGSDAHMRRRERRMQGFLRLRLLPLAASLLGFCPRTGLFASVLRSAAQASAQTSAQASAQAAASLDPLDLFVANGQSRPAVLTSPGLRAGLAALVSSRLADLLKAVPDFPDQLLESLVYHLAVLRGGQPPRSEPVVCCLLLVAVLLRNADVAGRPFADEDGARAGRLLTALVYALSCAGAAGCEDAGFLASSILCSLCTDIPGFLPLLRRLAQAGEGDGKREGGVVLRQLLGFLMDPSADASLAYCVTRLNMARVRAAVLSLLCDCPDIDSGLVHDKLCGLAGTGLPSVFFITYRIVAFLFERRHFEANTAAVVLQCIRSQDAPIGAALLIPVVDCFKPFWGSYPEGFRADASRLLDEYTSDAASQQNAPDASCAAATSRLQHVLVAACVFGPALSWNAVHRALSRAPATPGSGSRGEGGAVVASFDLLLHLLNASEAFVGLASLPLVELLMSDDALADKLPVLVAAISSDALLDAPLFQGIARMLLGAIRASGQQKPVLDLSLRCLLVQCPSAAKNFIVSLTPEDKAIVSGCIKGQAPKPSPSQPETVEFGEFSNGDDLALDTPPEDDTIELKFGFM